MRLTLIRMVTIGLLLTGFGFAPPAFAQEATAPDPSDVAPQTLVSADFVAAPAAPAFVAVTRIVLPPGTSLTSGATTGPRLIFVESGEVAIQTGEGSNGFLRAADAPPSMGSASGRRTEAVLAAGSHYLPSNDAVGFDLVNEGTRAASFFDAIVFPQAPLGLAPYTTMDGVVIDPLVGGVVDALPQQTMELRIERLTIAVGAEVVLPVSDGPRLLVVESGTLELTPESGVITYSGSAGLNPGSVAGRVRTADPGSRSLLRARSSVVIQTDATGTIGNGGRNELTLFSMSLHAVATASASAGRT